MYISCKKTIHTESYMLEGHSRSFKVIECLTSWHVLGHFHESRTRHYPPAADVINDVIVGYLFIIVTVVRRSAVYIHDHTEILT